MGLYIGSHCGRKGMLLVNQIKVYPNYTYDELRKKAAAVLKVFETEIKFVKIEKLSIDARKKPEIFYILSLLVDVQNENSVLKRCAPDRVSLYKEIKYTPSADGTERLINRPVVIGAGPAGLFCAYYLAKYGYKPIVFERGYDIDVRTKDVEEFFRTGILKRNSNVQFGEGGAGAFSDGKLNTLVKDHFGRNRAILELFVECGADENILTDAKPHIGTDVLVTVIKNLRAKIKSFGGEFRFNAEVTDIDFTDDKVSGIVINKNIKHPADVCVLAIGHSARNTFSMLYDKQVKLSQKEFAVGFRVEHDRKFIDDAMYGADNKFTKFLPTATYKLTYKASNDRGVYSFCMCPGGYVVNASSEMSRTCVNGMSYKARDSRHSNSAIIVTVGSKDFKSDHPLAGMYFQQKIEENAYNLAGGAIPVEYYKDFKNEVETGLTDLNNVEPDEMLSISPECKGRFLYSRLSEILPHELNETFVEGMEYFDRIIPGFAADNVIMSGIESRTSSPIRIERDEAFESVSHKGLYPAGEGAGYAGGIMSAAMDGMKVFEAIAAKYRSFEEKTDDDR